MGVPPQLGLTSVISASQGPDTLKQKEGKYLVFAIDVTGFLNS